MMGIGRCKDLDEWLVGSGESAETADSKRNGTAQNSSAADQVVDPLFDPLSSGVV